MKIGDFGLSCYCDPTKKGLNAFCGTDVFMAPEMLRLSANPSSLDNAFKKRTQNYNSRVDIWALGVVTYEMFFGYVPFDASDQGQRHFDTLFEEPSYGTLAAAATDFIQKCLTKDDKKRPNATVLLGHKWLKEFQDD